MYYYPQGAVAAPQFAPQGWVGDMVSSHAPLIGSTVGGIATELTGSPAAGGLIGGMTNVVARDYGHLIPFQAGPGAPVQYAPQGAIGRFAGGLVGGAIGNHFGHGQLGSTIGGIAGSFLPFQAGPGMAAQPVAYAPQGFWGDAIKTVGGAVGQVVGGTPGNIVRDVTGLAQYLPFQAGPSVAASQPAYSPQGFWGDAIKTVGGAVGQVVGGTPGNIIRDVTGLAQYLPFQAGPAVTVSQPTYSPQGFWGDAIKTVGGAVGQVVGGTPGNIVRDVTGLAQYLPFQAGPAVVASQPMYAPQGIFGSIGGGLVGGAIGKAFGNKAVGSAIGTAVGSLLPFQAGPGAPVQYVPVPTEQLVYH